MFTDIGQEVQHANELLARLNQWKKFRQVLSVVRQKFRLTSDLFDRLRNGKCQHRNERG